MADFSNSEKISASWKHLFGILGTSNGTGSSGKAWYEELLSASHVISPSDIWSSPIPYAGNYSQAINAVGPVVEDRSSSETITLTPTGSNWLVSSTIVPKIGYQITNVHPNPSYIKSITNIIDNGGGSYTITLNSNTGVAAGTAVLQSRIYLTLDPSSNGKAWFARSAYGDSFSALLQDFIQPQQFGKGYSLRLFKANGQEVFTTEGAWIFNYQKGVVLFATGFTPSDLGYQQPLYIQLFQYTGEFGLGGVLPDGDLNDTLRFDGTSWVPTSSVKSDGVNFTIENRLSVSGSVCLPPGVSPVTSGSLGDISEFRWDEKFLYIRTPMGWARTNISYF